MSGFICFMCGLFIGIFVMALFQVNRNLEDRKRAAHAVKMAEYYKDEYKKMKNKNKIGWNEND